VCSSDLVIAPIPGWFINAVSVMNTGLFFDKLDVGRFIGGSLKPLIVIAAEAQWGNRLLAQPEFEKLAESTNLNDRLTDRLVYGSKNNVFSDLYLLNQTYKNKIIGQANIKAMTVLIDAANQKQDTLPHEYAHHYIAYFRDTPIVQEGIKRFGGEEALVQAIGEQVVAQEGEAYNWWQKFTKWLLNLLSDKQVLQILTDSFLTRTDLATDFQYATEAPAGERTPGYLSARVVRNPDGGLRIDQRDLSKFEEDVKKEFGPKGKPPINRTGDTC